MQPFSTHAPPCLPPFYRTSSEYYSTTMQAALCVLLLGADMNLDRVHVKRSYCRYHKPRHSACCLLAHVQLSSPCLALPPPNQAKFVAGLTAHSSLILHTNLQGKVAAHPGWDLGFFLCIGGEKGRADCSCDAVYIGADVGCFLFQNIYHHHCVM